MKVVAQRLDDILGALQPLKVEWQDDVARRVIARLEKFPRKKVYSAADIQGILDLNFDDGLLICRLFLALSKDDFTAALKGALGGAGSGIKRYHADKSKFIDALVNLQLLEAVALNTDRKPKWSDVLVERLRSGRGSAISGQKRGRGVEDFAEAVVKGVFGADYGKRRTFTGSRNRRAKCDFAVPSKANPQIVIEAKGYGATGSKMTDVIGDIEKIIEAKRADTAFLFFTDGLTWNQRKSDLRKIVEYQNAGDIMRIYTSSMVDQFKADLEQLKSEYGL
jgi:DpnII restriction endonuclease